MSETIVAEHPGIHLAAALKARKITACRLAKHIGVPRNQVTEIVRGRRPVSPDMAMRLARAFGDHKEYGKAVWWIYAQARYNATREAKNASRYTAILPISAAPPP